MKGWERDILITSKNGYRKIIKIVKKIASKPPTKIRGTNSANSAEHLPVWCLEKTFWLQWPRVQGES